jgi:hypothetical protein
MKGASEQKNAGPVSLDSHNELPTIARRILACTRCDDAKIRVQHTKIAERGEGKQRIVVIGIEPGNTEVEMFLIGVALQVAVALIYKYVMWYLYTAELDPKLLSTRAYNVCDWISNSLFVESMFDLLTVIFFGTATVLVVFATVM